MKNLQTFPSNPIASLQAADYSDREEEQRKMQTTLFSLADIGNLKRVIDGHFLEARLYMEYASEKEGSAYRRSPSVRLQVQQLQNSIKKDRHELQRLSKSLEIIFSNR